MWSSSFERILWATGLSGQVALLFVLSYRRHVRRFPVLTSLIAYDIIENIFLFWLYKVGSASQQYFYYWRVIAFGFLGK